MSTDDQTGPRGGQRHRPHQVDALASSVISVLRDRQAVSIDGLRQFVLDHVVRAALARTAFEPDALLEELRGYRLTNDALIDLYVPAAAREIGAQWVDDRISFADVTIASMRLQSLLDNASAHPGLDRRVSREVMHTLVLVPRGEQHFLGSSVVAAQLRRMGCDVAISFDETDDALATRIIKDEPNLVLITCSRSEMLEPISQTVQIIREQPTQTPVIALGGAFQSEIEEAKEIRGVDIITSVAAEAVAFCAKRTRLKKLS